MTFDEAQSQWDNMEHPDFYEPLSEDCENCGNDFDDCECEE